MRSQIVIHGVLAGLAAILIAPQWVAAVDGPHDLSDSAPNHQQCLACHGSHKLPASQLLWNHVLSENNFSWSDATETTGGTQLPTNIKTWSGNSKMCLSCHDGSVAIGAIYSPPITFNEDKIEGKNQIGANGDLRGNHPVAIPYPYDRTKNTYNGITTGNNVTLWEFVDRPDTVRIYTDPAATGPSNHGIECGSCHDPHKDWSGGGGLYLRDGLENSRLCTRCHIK